MVFVFRTLLLFYCYYNCVIILLKCQVWKEFCLQSWFANLRSKSIFQDYLISVMLSEQISLVVLFYQFCAWNNKIQNRGKFPSLFLFVIRDLESHHHNVIWFWIWVLLASVLSLYLEVFIRVMSALECLRDMYRLDYDKYVNLDLSKKMKETKPCMNSSALFLKSLSLKHWIWNIYSSHYYTPSSSRNCNTFECVVDALYKAKLLSRSWTC